MKYLPSFFAIVVFLAMCTSCDNQKQAANYKCPCSKIGLDSSWADSNKISCYVIPVLKNSLKPSDEKFSLAVVVAPALNESKQEPLLYLHGGPGYATLGNVPRYLESSSWKLIREKRSLIFFDYRGTGFSEPTLCPDMEDALSLFSKNNASTEARQAYKMSLYKECASQLFSSGIDVSTFNSAQLAEDAESVRSALQIDSWNVYGVSFGTTVALNLLRNHGETINSMILDSPFPPNAPWLDFVRPFETCFKVLEKKISDNPDGLSHFPSIRTDFTNAVKRLNKTPASIIENEGWEANKYSGDDFAWSIWTAMLNPKTIPFVPLAIREVGSGNDSILPKWIAAFSGPDSFGRFSEPQSNAILCYESRPQTASDTKESLLMAYPDFSSFAIDFEGELCDAWQPRSASSQAFEAVTSKVPVLILAGEYDPVCPPLFAEITSKTLSKSTLIIVPSASHAAIHVDDCIRNIANSFISNPKVTPQIECVNDRLKIEFVTDNLLEALENYKK
ncbi:MAG: alpha/beta fold hydrolase [Aquaticitalea sp.]